MTTPTPKVPTGGGMPPYGVAGMLPLDTMAANVTIKAKALGIRERSATTLMLGVAEKLVADGRETDARVVMEAAQELLERAAKCRDEAQRWHGEYQGLRETTKAQLGYAARLAESCGQHGEQIRLMRVELQTLTASNEWQALQLKRSEQARTLLMAWVTECGRFAETARARIPDVRNVILWMERNVKQIRDRHKLIMSPPEPPQ